MQAFAHGPTHSNTHSSAAGTTDNVVQHPDAFPAAMPKGAMITVARRCYFFRATVFFTTTWFRVLFCVCGAAVLACTVLRPPIARRGAHAQSDHPVYNDTAASLAGTRSNYERARAVIDARRRRATGVSLDAADALTGWELAKSLR